MNWKMLDLAVRRLNVSALREWKDTLLGMSIWMQAIVVGALVLLIGTSVLSCWWGLKMKRSAKFAAGAAAVFHIVLIILIMEYSVSDVKALLIAAASGVGAGFLYAFAERFFQFAAGFVFGTALPVWIFPKFFHMKATEGKGRIWTLVIAIAAGVLFALLAKKLRWVLTALEGGVVLGLLCDAFLPVNRIPLVKDKLTDAQTVNLLPLVIAASGVLIQLMQLLSIRAEQRALAIPTGEERDRMSDPEQEQNESAQSQEEGEAAPPDEDAISMEQAEEVLVEKAKELALAAARSAEHVRLRERCEDVAAGLYSAKIAAERLGMSEEAFEAEMKRAGYQVPGTQTPQTEETAESPAGETPQDEAAADGASDDEAPQDEAAAGGAPDSEA